jgi:2,3,4,5-tetrahydropyridine-2,6-dicarboxylate N-succinyltransferase
VTETGARETNERTLDPILADLDAGRRRAAWPDPAVPGGWRVDPGVKAAILDLFRTPEMASWEVGDVFAFRDRSTLPTKALLPSPAAEDPRWRIVPGGSSVRAGVYLGRTVTIMPPSYVNVGAWIGDETMVDSLVLVGSCAQIGARVHLSAGVIVGGVLEPPNARPVIVEDDAFVGAGCSLLEGVLVGRGAVLGAGVTLTGTSRLYDLVGERVLTGTFEEPLAVPPGAVVVPGTRALGSVFARDAGLAVGTSVIVKMRDGRTAARVTLEEALR